VVEWEAIRMRNGDLSLKEVDWTIESLYNDFIFILGGEGGG
jgi:hypothetical protein